MKTKLISVLIFLSGVGLGLLYHFDFRSQNVLTYKARCAKDGEVWVLKNMEIFPPDRIMKQNYVYSSELQTCLVDVQRDMSTGLMYDIYDIYSGKDVASYSFPNPKLGLSVSTMGSPEEYNAIEKKYFSE